MGGADERHLLARARHEGLLSEPVARALGLDTPADAQERERLSLAQLLRVPRFSVLNRRTEGVDPVAASPALDAIAMARRRAGLPAFADGEPFQQARQVAAAPVHRPAPAAAADLPARLSASTLESLRACPYRFFSRAVLSLREAEELDAGVDKRDYGNWLHAVLDRFHRERPAERLADEPRLRELADTVSAEMDLSQARLLPFRIVFDALVPTYLAWLHQREDEGLHWAEGEFAVERQPLELGGSLLHGRIDRLDRGAGRVRVVDYKTGSVSRLQAQLRNPLEDTQLPFYALLMQADLAADDRVFEALYLALDHAEGPQELLHKDVVDSARTMLAGLADELHRLRGGAGLPALGEGSACEHCEARGLCRRDHWQAPP
jgi:ATP-dependent helicase/nuclease subunit B